MIVARWKIDARFGHKPEVLDSLQRWSRDIGKQVGLKPEKMRILTGSVGASESCVMSEIELDSLEELNRAWDKLSTLDAHREWSKKIEPWVVSGSNVWEVYRVV